MTSSHLKILLVLLLVLGLLSFFISAGGSSKSSRETNYLLSDLSTENIAKVVLEKGEQECALALVDGQWTVPDRNNYPADNSKVRSFFLKLLDLSSSQRVPASVDSFAKLGVAEDSTKSGSGKISFYDAAGESLGGIILGEKRQRKQQAGLGAAANSGQYVRRVGKNDVYIIGLSLPLNLSPTNWMDSSLVNVRQASVHSVHQYSLNNNQKTEVFSLAREEAVGSGKVGELELTVPPGADQEIEEPVISQVRGGLENVKFSDVKATSDVSDFSPDREIEYFLSSGLIYAIQTMKKDEKILSKVAVRFDQSLVDKSSQAESEEESAASAEPEAEPEKTASSAEDAAKLNGRFSSWVYELPDFQGNKYRYSRKDLIKDKELAPPPEEAAIPEPTDEAVAQ